MKLHLAPIAVFAAAGCQPAVVQQGGQPGPGPTVPGPSGPGAPWSDAGSFTLPDGGGSMPAGNGPGGMPAGPTYRQGPFGGTYVDPKLVGDPAAQFSGSPALGSGPEIVYPLDGSMHAINIRQLRVLWRPNGRANAYRIRFQNARGTYDLFTSCAADTCTLDLPEAVWGTIAAANPDADVALTVAAAASAGGLPTSRPLKLHISPDALDGGLYYWSTEIQGTYRLAFGQRQPMPFLVPGARNGPDAHICFGCHAVSRDGKTIAAVTEGLSRYVAMPTDDLSQRFSGDGVFISLSPDGRLIAAVDRQTSDLTVRDTRTGAEVARTTGTVFGGGEDIFDAEWSPDGRSIAVSFETRDGGAQIGVVPFDGRAFGTGRVLTTDGTEKHLPTWAPDGRWLAFVRYSALGPDPVGPPPAPGFGPHQDRDLALVSIDGGPIHTLARGVGMPDARPNMPKFTPFSQLGGKLMFLTFDSYLPQAFDKRTLPQLWLMAIDLRRLSDKDPSWAPVWLPFQNEKEGNHLAYWAEIVSCQENASSSVCGPDARCRTDRCMVVID